MNRHLLALAAAALFFLAVPTTSDAQVFFGTGSYRPWHHPTGARGFWHGPKRAPSYPEYYHFMNHYYPKFYGGFHASYFQTIGITPGDYGLRGNGFMQNPW